MYQHWSSVVEFLKTELKNKEYKGSKMQLQMQLDSAKLNRDHAKKNE